jgi:hypothetical protein
MPAPKNVAARTAGAGAAARAPAPRKEVCAVTRCALAIVIAAIGTRGGLSWSEGEDFAIEPPAGSAILLTVRGRRELERGPSEPLA